MLDILVATLLITIVLFAHRPAAASTFKAAAAVRDITPDPLLPVSGGVDIPIPTTDTRGALTVRALVLEQGDVRVALASVDSLGWPSVWGDKTRALVPGIAPQNILISATHTHSAPDAYCFPIDIHGNHAADLNYLEWVCVQMADAINEATAQLRPAMLKVNIAKAAGKIAYNYYAPELYDPRCGVLQVLDPHGGGVAPAIATLVNYAIHPEILGPDKGLLSPDLCGPLYAYIEAECGGTALFINSAQGGMVTADNRSDQGDMETWAECIRIGEQLGTEALRIIADAPVQHAPVLDCMAREITLPVDTPLMQMLLQNSPLATHMKSAESVNTMINVVTVGTAQMLTIPGEALPNIGYYLKRNMPTCYPFLLGLTNDAFGYMLTRYDFDSFERYDYISSTSLGEMTGERYIEEALRLVAAAPRPEDV